MPYGRQLCNPTLITTHELCDGSLADAKHLCWPSFWTCLKCATRSLPGRLQHMLSGSLIPVYSMCDIYSITGFRQLFLLVQQSSDVSSDSDTRAFHMLNLVDIHEYRI